MGQPRRPSTRDCRVGREGSHWGKGMGLVGLGQQKKSSVMRGWKKNTPSSVEPPGAGPGFRWGPMSLRPLGSECMYATAIPGGMGRLHAEGAAAGGRERGEEDGKGSGGRESMRGRGGGEGGVRWARLGWRSGSTAPARGRGRGGSAAPAGHALRGGGEILGLRSADSRVEAVNSPLASQPLRADCMFGCSGGGSKPQPLKVGKGPLQRHAWDGRPDGWPRGWC